MRRELIELAAVLARRGEPFAVATVVARTPPISAQVGDVALASMKTAAGGARVKPAARAAIKPFDGSNVFLFTPTPAYRVHYQPMIGRADQLEYPAAGARIDYYLASPAGEVKLDILDAAGTVIDRAPLTRTAAAARNRRCAAGGGRGSRAGSGYRAR